MMFNWLPSLEKGKWIFVGISLLGLSFYLGWDLSKKYYRAMNNSFKAYDNGIEEVMTLTHPIKKTAMDLGEEFSFITGKRGKDVAQQMAASIAGFDKCYIAFDLQGVLAEFSIPKRYKSVLIETVVAHELAHCIDKKNRVNLTLDEQWEEGFADVFALGYIRLQYPDISKEFVNIWQAFRAKSNPEAPHFTGCWIESSKFHHIPKNPSQLKDWTVKIMASSPCS